MIEVLLDHQLVYYCCTCVLQAQVVSPSVQARANRSRRHVFSGRDSYPPWRFLRHPLKLYRGTSGAYCGRPLNSYWNSGHSWSEFRHIHWGFFGTGIVCSGVGSGSVVGMTGGAQGILRCRSLAIDSTALVVVSPLVKKGSCILGLLRTASMSPIDCRR